MYAWKASNLKQVPIEEKLINNLSLNYSDMMKQMLKRNNSDKDNVKPLLDIRFCGKNHYIMMKYHTCTDNGKVFKQWKLFNVKSGNEVFEMNNNFISKFKDG